MCTLNARAIELQYLKGRCIMEDVKVEQGYLKQ